MVAYPYGIMKLPFHTYQVPSPWKVTIIPTPSPLLDSSVKRKAIEVKIAKKSFAMLLKQYRFEEGEQTGWSTMSTKSSG